MVVVAETSAILTSFSLKAQDNAPYVVSLLVNLTTEVSAEAWVYCRTRLGPLLPQNLLIAFTC